MNLIESYRNRLAISESVHQKSHNGAKMSASKKMMIASVLNNTSRFMNEAFESSAATQRSALGDFKKFCLNISTVSLPNLILPELMMTQPMTSITGYITYLRYSAGVQKGGVNQGDLFSSVYRLGEMTENRARYTSDRVVEPVETFVSGTTKVAWTPVVTDSAKLLAADGSVVPTTSITVAADGTVTATFEGGEPAAPVKKIAYVYDNVVIPQNSTPNSLPTLTARMTGVTLQAHARRIAVYYSQIAAFQAKTDYGYDLGENLATQAQGELAYEIDSEGVLMLVNGAEERKDDHLTFNSYEASVDANTPYISRSQYYEQFAEIINRAKQVIYRRTQKFSPNFMIVGSNILTILPYLKGWNAAPVSSINGPYFAGTVENLKVFVSPAMDANTYVFGVNGSDLQTSAAVYAPYMAIVPTQLLGFADGGMSQGFSTMYDMKLLSTYTRNGETITESEDGAGGQYSYLLVKGHMNTTVNP